MMKNSLTTTVESFIMQASRHSHHKTKSVILSLLKCNQVKSRIKMSFVIHCNGVICFESPRPTAGDTIAYVARENPVSDFEGVLKTRAIALLPSIREGRMSLFV